MIEAQQTELTTPTFVDMTPDLALPCPKCDRRFKSGPSLRMHQIRKHGKGWSTSANFKRRGQQHQTEEQRLAQRRKYQAKLRERYKLEGKDSRGYPRTNKGAKWTPERRARFESTWRSKNRRRIKEAKRIQIVYPKPTDSELTRLQENERRIQDEAIANTWPQPEDIHIATLRYCPNCGECVEKWRFQS